MALSDHTTVPAVRAHKVRTGADPLVMVTAYDAPGARIADEAGVDMILVGDSLAMVVLGYEDTLSVTVDDIAHHVGAVARAKPRPLIVADLPWMSYHVSTEDTVCNAAKLIRAGAQCVKLEGGIQAGAHDRGAGGRGDPRHGSPRPHPPVDACHGWLPGPGQGIRSGARPGGRRQGPGPCRVLRRRARGRSGSGRGARHRCHRRARPSASEPARRATARSWCSTTCWESRTVWRPSSCAGTRT